MFVFDPLLCSTTNSDEGFNPNEEQVEVLKLKPMYPELGHWSDSAFVNAWSVFSEACFALSWVYWIDEYSGMFLGYLYLAQTNPETPNCCGFACEMVEDAARRAPWLTP